eukprot:jgi/Mesvir1/8899/Mv02781-RA.4
MAHLFSMATGQALGPGRGAKQPVSAAEQAQLALDKAQSFLSKYKKPTSGAGTGAAGPGKGVRSSVMAIDSDSDLDDAKPTRLAPNKANQGKGRATGGVPGSQPGPGGPAASSARPISAPHVTAQQQARETADTRSPGNAVQLASGRTWTPPGSGATFSLDLGPTATLRAASLTSNGGSSARRYSTFDEDDDDAVISFSDSDEGQQEERGKGDAGGRKAGAGGGSAAVAHAGTVGPAASKGPPQQEVGKGSAPGRGLQQQDGGTRGNAGGNAGTATAAAAGSRFQSAGQLRQFGRRTLDGSERDIGVGAMMGRTSLTSSGQFGVAGQQGGAARGSRTLGRRAPLAPEDLDESIEEDAEISFSDEEAEGNHRGIKVPAPVVNQQAPVAAATAAGKGRSFGTAAVAASTARDPQRIAKPARAASSSALLSGPSRYGGNVMLASDLEIESDRESDDAKAAAAAFGNRTGQRIMMASDLEEESDKDSGDGTRKVEPSFGNKTGQRVMMASDLQVDSDKDSDDGRKKSAPSFGNKTGQRVMMASDLEVDSDKDSDDGRKKSAPSFGNKTGQRVMMASDLEVDSDKDSDDGRKKSAPSFGNKTGQRVMMASDLEVDSDKDSDDGRKKSAPSFGNKTGQRVMMASDLEVDSDKDSDDGKKGVSSFGNRTGQRIMMASDLEVESDRDSDDGKKGVSSFGNRTGQRIMMASDLEVESDRDADGGNKATSAFGNRTGQRILLASDLEDVHDSLEEVDSQVATEMSDEGMDGESFADSVVSSQRGVHPVAPLWRVKDAGPHPSPSVGGPVLLAAKSFNERRDSTQQGRYGSQVRGASPSPSNSDVGESASIVEEQFGDETASVVESVVQSAYTESFETEASGGSGGSRRYSDAGMPQPTRVAAQVDKVLVAEPRSSVSASVTQLRRSSFTGPMASISQPQPQPSQQAPVIVTDSRNRAPPGRISVAGPTMMPVMLPPGTPGLLSPSFNAPLGPARSTTDAPETTGEVGVGPSGARICTVAVQVGSMNEVGSQVTFDRRNNMLWEGGGLGSGLAGMGQRVDGAVLESFGAASGFVDRGGVTFGPNGAALLASAVDLVMPVQLSKGVVDLSTLQGMHVAKWLAGMLV